MPALCSTLHPIVKLLASRENRIRVWFLAEMSIPLNWRRISRFKLCIIRKMAHRMRIYSSTWSNLFRMNMYFSQRTRTVWICRAHFLPFYFFLLTLQNSKMALARLALKSSHLLRYLLSSTILTKSFVSRSFLAFICLWLLWKDFLCRVSCSFYSQLTIRFLFVLIMGPCDLRLNREETSFVSCSYLSSSSHTSVTSCFSIDAD